jgi:hypothetical protein
MAKMKLVYQPQDTIWHVPQNVESGAIWSPEMVCITCHVFYGNLNGTHVVTTILRATCDTDTDIADLPKFHTQPARNLTDAIDEARNWYSDQIRLLLEHDNIFLNEARAASYYMRNRTTAV